MKSKKKTITWIVILIVAIALCIFAWTKNGNQMTEEVPTADSIEVAIPDTTIKVETPKVDSTKMVNDSIKLDSAKAQKIELSIK